MAKRSLQLLLILAIAASCTEKEEASRPVPASVLDVTVSPLATIAAIGSDTLSDSARIQELRPEPDGGSVAFIFADPAKAIMRGLGIVQRQSQTAQLVWPDSVTRVWWSSPHQLSFTAGTGQGVRLVVDAHAAQLQTMEVTRRVEPAPTVSREGQTQAAGADALTRAQAFIDSVRIQPRGQPQRSALRYQADSALMSNDTLAAIHVSAQDSQGNRVNPAWYLMHIPSGQLHGIDSLTGRSLGLAASAGQWGQDGIFYYTKERAIWRAEPRAERQDR